jgi:hypothetical protein
MKTQVSMTEIYLHSSCIKDVQNLQIQEETFSLPRSSSKYESQVCSFAHPNWTGIRIRNPGKSQRIEIHMLGYRFSTDF